MQAYYKHDEYNLVVIQQSVVHKLTRVYLEIRVKLTEIK